MKECNFCSGITCIQTKIGGRIERVVKDTNTQTVLDISPMTISECQEAIDEATGTKDLSDDASWEGFSSKNIGA